MGGEQLIVVYSIWYVVVKQSTESKTIVPAAAEVGYINIATIQTQDHHQSQAADEASYMVGWLHSGDMLISPEPVATEELLHRIVMSRCHALSCERLNMSLPVASRLLLAPFE